MLCLNLQAPFGAFRTFTAGSFRPTAEFITPSAAYGLLLNIAGIEMRQDDEDHVMTLIKTDLPSFHLALGAVSFPLQHSIYQQLHNYPVGTSAKEHAEDTKGNKYNIVPARRALLSDINAYVCIDGNEEIEAQITEGLKGNSPRTYGLPFMGDNNFLIDKLEPVEKPSEAYWFVPVSSDHESGLREHVTRLTIAIDRADMSQTSSALFAPTKEPSSEIPKDAWVEVGY
ncbi:CRISPR-associated protein Cas5 [candidate division WOR-3 bacterium]|nr:CRISPR-associated protein Cas5 [candidate division WOR-3 bacterium]